MVVEWNRPSEELPKEGKDILFKPCDANVLVSGISYNGIFCAHHDDSEWNEDEVAAWCYAPSLPDWYAEERMDKKACDVFVTEEYSKFKHLKGNRGVESRRVRRIKQSINAVGYVMNPIVVNENMEVIDGQGRLEVLEDLNLPVYYVVAEGAGIEECRQLNIGQSNWRLIDYIESYAEDGIDSYKRLSKLCNEKRSISIAPECIVGVAMNQIVTSGGLSKYIKNGDLYITNEDAKAVKLVLDFIEDHYEGINAIEGSTRVKITAICWAIRNTEIDVKRLGDIIDKKNAVFKAVANEAFIRFLEDISDIYNKGLPAKKCVYLADTYRRFARKNV